MNSNKNTEYNPFVKPDDIIVLKDRKGRFKVVQTDKDKITVIAEPNSDKKLPFTVIWSEFNGWRSK